MDARTLNLLEFHKILKELDEYCLSSCGRKLLAMQKILNKEKDVLEFQDICVAFRKILDAGNNLPALTFPDIEIAIKHLKKKGTVLEPAVLAAIARFIRSARRFKIFITKKTDNIRLKQIALDVPELEQVAREILKIIDNNGQVKATKIPELKQINQKIKSLKNQATSKVNSYFNNEMYNSFWQSNLPTIKDGRLVLPLKANFKGRIKGVIHEVSASGATVFIEPLDIVDTNNLIVNQQNEYKKALFKLIKELTAKVAEALFELKQMTNNIALLDTIQARASYSIKHKCIPAQPKANGINLLNARHPLLGKSVVPITLIMQAEERVLIITGPNTGGKTVSLKTTGLLCLMNQFGMEIPADEGTELPIFDNIFADIGDEQSIEQSLSTFSSHMVAIANTITQATGKSLVLLDELGAGTDPEEGVAIAMALLDFFIDKGCLTITTTHHGILKNYGYIKHGVKNACMEFDKNTLAPTFKMILGIPGESHALFVAQRNGISFQIIKNAIAYLSNERTDISQLIRTLSEKQRDLVAEQEKHKLKQKEVNEKLRQAELKELKLRQKENELREMGLKQMKDYLLQSRKLLESVVKELRENKDIDENIKTGREIINGLEDRIEKETKQLGKNQNQQGENKKVALTPGMEVILKETGDKAKLLRKIKGDKWLVETEKYKITVDLNELDLINIKKPENDLELSLPNIQTTGVSIFELDLRGYHLDEAIRAVDKQIDNALINAINEFGIIHGKGMGILQEGIHEHLKNLEYVEDFFFARPELGGTGKTIVRLKL